MSILYEIGPLDINFIHRSIICLDINIYIDFKILLEK